MMRIGTCNFKTFEKAFDYYAAMGFSREDVEYKRAQGDFEVGKPALLRGQRAVLDADARYYIEDDLSVEQRQALDSFMGRHGRQWKEVLVEYWLTGRDAHEPEGHLLRQIRNQLGTHWLSKY